MNSELLQGFYLGDLLVEPLKGQVTGRAGSEHIPPKAMEVLLCLANDPAELVTREQLINEVWGEGHGSDEALSHAISEIRHALDDHPDEPTYIQTLPRRGYRLVITPEFAADHSSTIILGTSNGATVADISFFENLKRRGVLETAIAYLIVGWLLIQIADIVFSQLHLPEWAGTFVTLLVIAGFPISILLSWFLEFRGGKAVVDLSPLHERRRRFSRTYLSVISALGVAGVLVYMFDHFVGLPEGVEIVEQAREELLPIAENSLAVLRLANFDDDPRTRAFAAGLSEDILDGLARLPGLHVPSRGDSWSLDPNTPSAEVRRRLRVNNYIEGSVEFYHEHLKVTVQLIDSQTGYHIFSRDFEIEESDIGSMQREITSLVVANLKLAIDIGPQHSATYHTDTPERDAYLLYMLGHEAILKPPSAETIAEAIDYFDRALKVDSDYPAALAGLCESYAIRYQRNEDLTDIELAWSACSRALAIAPRLPAVMDTVANLYVTTGRVDAAHQLFTASLSVDPQNADALAGLARIARRQQNPNEAIRLMERVAELQPGNWGAFNTLGGISFRMGRYDQAVAYFRRAVYLDPGNHVAAANLAAAGMMGGDFATARDGLIEAAATYPDPTIQMNLGIAHYYLGEYDEAIAALRQAVLLAPSAAGINIALADALSAAGEEQEATQSYRQALVLSTERINLDNEDVEALTFLAWSSAKTGDQEAAVAHIERALELDSTDPYSHYYDGIVRLHGGEVDAAIDALTIAAEGGFSVAMLSAEPILKELRGDLRFEALVAEDP